MGCLLIYFLPSGAPATREIAGLRGGRLAFETAEPKPPTVEAGPGPASADPPRPARGELVGFLGLLGEERV
jgi:hypothetical protein